MTNPEALAALVAKVGGPVCDDCATDRIPFRQRQIAYQAAELLNRDGRVARKRDICRICGKLKKTSAPCSNGGPGIRERTFGPESAGMVEAWADRSGAGDPVGFELDARKAMSAHFGTSLAPRPVSPVPKVWDYVSPEGQVVGDAKYYSLVNGTGLPPAKFSAISEHAWLLHHVPAEHRFLVFGNDRRVPRLWLDRYGDLAPEIEFYFLDADGNLEQLKDRL